MIIMGSGEFEYKPVDYKEYRASKFEKTKQKVRMILSGVKDTSLKPDDKAKLIQEIKKIVSDYDQQ